METLTIGLDLGDRRHQACVLDEAGEILAEEAMVNTREVLTALCFVSTIELPEHFGGWSRRINEEHRFVYKVIGDDLWIAQLQYHYEQQTEPIPGFIGAVARRRTEPAFGSTLEVTPLRRSDRRTRVG